MKNFIIGLVIALFLFGGWWYFMGRSPQEVSMGHENMEEMKMENTDENTNMNVVECPVMGTKLSPSSAYGKTEYQGKTYYFCCAGCPAQFEANPENYIK
jgi:YHS domain-containing protein